MYFILGLLHKVRKRGKQSVNLLQCKESVCGVLTVYDGNLKLFWLSIIPYA